MPSRLFTCARALFTHAWCHISALDPLNTSRWCSKHRVGSLQCALDSNVLVWDEDDN